MQTESASKPVLEESFESLKPERLFHASSNTQITEFEPRAEGVRDSEEGPVVFATPDKAYASMFIVPTDDRWTSKGRIDNGPWTCVIGDIERYKALDRGGAIYGLDRKTFETDPNRNLHKVEWVSKEPVVPRTKEAYDSGLKAMIASGVRVYVIDSEQFNVFNFLIKEKNYKEAYGMLQGLQPETA